MELNYYPNVTHKFYNTIQLLTISESLITELHFSEICERHGDVDCDSVRGLLHYHRSHRTNLSHHSTHPNFRSAVYFRFVLYLISAICLNKSFYFVSSTLSFQNVLISGKCFTSRECGFHFRLPFAAKFFAPFTLTCAIRLMVRLLTFQTLKAFMLTYLNLNCFDCESFQIDVKFELFYLNRLNVEGLGFMSIFSTGLNLLQLCTLGQGGESGS